MRDRHALRPEASTLQHVLRDSALISEPCKELNRGIFSSCPVGLDDADVMKFGKAENCRVI